MIEEKIKSTLNYKTVFLMNLMKNLAIKWVLHLVSFNDIMSPK